MAKLTVINAAPLVGKSTQTIYRHIKQGKLSKGSDGLIDTVELLRVYGELKSIDTTEGHNPNISLVHAESDNVTWYKSQIEQLQRDIRDLRQEGIDRENRLMALLENKSSAEGTVSGVGGLFGKLFK